MHDAALAFVRQWALAGPISVLELGSLFINGSARQAFPAARYTGLDLVAGPGVDLVADAATWVPDRQFDVVVSTEVFEHCAQWHAICVTAWDALTPAGLFIVTCAGPGRAPHSAVDGGPLREGEFYENVKAVDLHAWLELTGFDVLVCQSVDGDTQAAAVKR